MRAATTLALLGLLALVGTTVATPAPQEFNAIEDFGADENGADNDMDTEMSDLTKRDLQRTTVTSTLFDAPFILDVKNQKTHLQRSKPKPKPVSRRRKGRGNKYVSRRPGVGGRFGQRYRASGPKRGRGTKGHHKRDFQRTKESSSMLAAPFILDVKEQKTHLQRPSRPIGGAHGSAKPGYGRYKRDFQRTKESSSTFAAPFILDIKKQKTHLQRPSRPIGGAHGSAKPGYGRYKRDIQRTKESSSVINVPFILDVKKQKTHLQRPSRPIGGAHGSSKPGYGHKHAGHTKY
ncbi:hypothetical protein IWQ60_006471 [Tieghemiomyces parasiticus]|uniref:Uncharacterized protein n=1 Tax=Tieghemiomyces parasiticus TaxID=78921 RepID=A0A9W8A822_9FUNG|nr:hypothetical protein IWQ60_006471 [Tieghemiomyces parasiticus]